MSYLIDTDIIIFSLRGDSSVQNKFREHRFDNIYTSAITIGELTYGAEKSTQRERNLNQVEHIKNCFPIIDITSEIMEIFGRLKAKQEECGIVVADMDLQIASVAIHRNLTLVTNNVKHFSKIENLKIENWKEN